MTSHATTLGPRPGPQPGLARCPDLVSESRWRRRESHHSGVDRSQGLGRDHGRAPVQHAGCARPATVHHHDLPDVDLPDDFVLILCNEPGVSASCDVRIPVQRIFCGPRPASTRSGPAQHTLVLSNPAHVTVEGDHWGIEPQPGFDASGVSLEVRTPRIRSASVARCRSRPSIATATTNTT